MAQKNKSLPERDFCIRVTNLPIEVAALTAMDCDGFYSVYINARMPLDRQRKAYAHELIHIRRHDFDNFLPIHMIE